MAFGTISPKVKMIRSIEAETMVEVRFSSKPLSNAKFNAKTVPKEEARILTKQLPNSSVVMVSS